MTVSKINKSTGFTIIEVIVSIAVFSVLTLPAAAFLISMMQTPKSQLAAMESVDQARFVSSRFTSEIRSATYGSYPLIGAGDSEIIFYSPVGASAGKINRIRYYISGGNLYRGVIVPVSGIYNPATEITTPVLNGLSNEGVPLFYYYDGSYDGVTYVVPLSQPVNVNQVKFVKINLIVKKQLSPQDTGTFSLNVGAAIRVLKNNLSD